MQPRLEIPTCALPEGVIAADISVNLIPLDQIPPVDGLAAVAGYELQPDGLQLLAPVLLTVQLAFAEIPPWLLPVHRSADAWELVTIVDSVSDPDTGTIVLSVQLLHFSNNYTYMPAPERLPSLIPDIPLGEVDPLVVTIVASANKVEVEDTFEVTATIVSRIVPGTFLGAFPFGRTPHLPTVGLG